jgi:acetyltransferase-like isoleucine patch superfamily enzyme
MIEELYIIGAGGLGREVLANFNAVNFSNKYKNIFFIDYHEGTVKGHKIIGNNDYLKQLNYPVDVFIAVSSCKVRLRIINELEQFEHLNFISFIHPNAYLYDKDSISIGKGCFIGQGTILTTDITVKDFCYLNVNVSLHHDTIVERNCFLMPGVRITGGAIIGENTFIGNNYQISEKLEIPAFSNLLNEI